MPLPSAVQYSRQDTFIITWTFDDDTATPTDLTGATLYGVIRRGTTETAITGTLALVTAASGIFSWAPSEADVAQDGTFLVQFYAKYSNQKPKLSSKHRWFVEPSFNFPFTSPSVSPSVSPSASASPSASKSPSASVSPSSSASRSPSASA